MKTLLLATLLIFQNLAFSQENTQVFNDYTGNFSVESVNFTHYTVSFKGEATVVGELIFDLRHGEGPDPEGIIYKIKFIPDDTNIFPEISSGFYAKPLTGIDFYDRLAVKEKIFNAIEWENILEKS